MKGEAGQRVRGGALGLGLLLGGATFSYGLSQGCSKAEILAINDDGGCQQGRGEEGGLTVQGACWVLLAVQLAWVYCNTCWGLRAAWQA